MTPIERPEHLRSMKEVANLIGVPYYQIVRAVKDGLLPSYTISNSKKYLLLSEVMDTIKSSSGEARNV